MLMYMLKRQSLGSHMSSLSSAWRYRSYAALIVTNSRCYNVCTNNDLHTVNSSGVRCAPRAFSDAISLSTMMSP